MSKRQMVLELQKELGWKDPTLAKAMGVAKQTARSYRINGVEPGDDKVENLSRYIGESRRIPPHAIADWIFAGQPTPPPLTPQENGIANQTSVYHNDERRDDSGTVAESLSSLRKYASPLTARVNVLIGRGSDIWSAKGVRTTIMHVRAWAIEEGQILVLTDGDNLGAHNRSVVFGFKPDPYPYQNRWLLLQNKEKKDLRTVRYIDGHGPFDVLKSIDPRDVDLPLSEWSILGYANIRIDQNAGGGEPKVAFDPQGFGPGIR